MSIADSLRAEIARLGPIPFSRFMEVALYDPMGGYYRRDHFGRGGDYFTAEQLQPVFGLLLRRWCEQQGIDRIVQLGAGRAALAETFAGLEYTPIDIGYGAWPEGFRGLVLAHEFFDALPVDLVERGAAGWRERRVGISGGRFVWSAGAVMPRGEAAADVNVMEVPVGMERALRQIAAHTAAGHLLVLDYGYTHREQIRFPQGSVMSYRRHCAIDDVLLDPGEQDITAHVPFTTLERLAAECGFALERSESLGSFLLGIGEADEFRFLKLEQDAGRRLQLKTLLFDLGESFRALWFTKREGPVNRAQK
ncbi:MAG: SAM-dependent methyltransferase [Acidobacteria bacterium]|nr:SAM-dependent methyltransferase [Acidobacteriota bacterium]